MSGEVILAGRGRSIADFIWPDDSTPIAAVSSGIFMKHLPRRPEHFIGIDPPRFYVKSHKRWMYFEDPWVRWFDFCNDPNITKHVPHYDIPVEPLLDLLRASPKDNAPDPTVPNPSWSEFPNVRRWEFIHDGPINFTQGPLGGSELRHSTFFALQVLHRLGFTRVAFAGIDLSGPTLQKYAVLLNTTRTHVHGFHWPHIPIKGEEGYGCSRGKRRGDHVLDGLHDQMQCVDGHAQR